MPWRQDFFVGWAGHLPTAQAAAIRAVVASAVTIFLLLGLALARSGPDPGGGDGIGDEVTLRGVLTARPYPTLTLPPAPGATVGRTIMLAGGGKTAPPFDPALDGQPVAATGYMLRRGVLDMLQVGDPSYGASPARSATASATPAQCGRAPASPTAPAPISASPVARPPGTPRRSAGLLPRPQPRRGALTGRPALGKARALPWTHQGSSPWTLNI